MPASTSRHPLAPAPRHRWPGFHGITLAADSWGDPDAPLVVLLHGGGQTRHAWGGTGELLAASGYRAVAFDARGHGDSDWSDDGEYGDDAMVEDLVRVVETAAGGRPALVGASMGGDTALVAAGEGHVDATTLVLVDIAPRVEVGGVERIEAFMNRDPQGFGSLDDVADAVASYQPRRARPTTSLGLAKNVRVGADGRLYWHWDPDFLPAHRDLERRERRLDACARALELPTLLVRGGLSDVISDDGVGRFAQMCPGADYVSIADAAHMVAGDRNDRFASVVTSFLDRRAHSHGNA